MHTISASLFARSTTSMLGLLMMTALVLVTTAPVEASDFSGNIQTLRFSTGTTAARVSIEVGNHGSPCLAVHQQWYSFENADKGLGVLWSSALTTALGNKQNVTIFGSGKCDKYGVEGVNYIDFK